MYVITIYDSENQYRYAWANRALGRNYEMSMAYKHDKFHMESDRWTKARTIFMNTDREEDVKEVAREVAKNNPGCDVMYGQMSKAMGSGESPVVEKKVSKAGILPA